MTIKMTQEDALKTLYRYAAKSAHPDGGGTNDAMLVVQQAMEALRQPMPNLAQLLADLQRENQRQQDYLQRETQMWQELKRRQEESLQREAAFEAQMKQVHNNGPVADSPKSDPVQNLSDWINNPTQPGPRCRVCGHTYQATRSDARFCSSTCRNAAWRHQHPTKRKYYRPLHPTCVVCGTKFDARRKSARYCSSACAQVAYRRRKAEANG